MAKKPKLSARADAQKSLKQIMETAERVLDDNPAATLFEIAQSAGLTRVTIYRHFKNRADLLEALTEAAFQDSLAVFTLPGLSKMDFVSGMEKITLGFLHSAAHWRAISFHDRQSKNIQRYREQLADSLNKVIKKGIKEGVIHANVDLIWARHMYMGLIKQTKSREKELGYSLEKLSRMIVKTFLHGFSS